MTRMSDLSGDLIGEILRRVPLTSLSAVRSTCKNWNDLSKSHIFGKEAKEARKQFLCFMLVDSRIFSLKFDLQGIRNDDFVYPSIKQLSILNQVKIFRVYYCDGLFLCSIKDDMRFVVVWNPYLGQTRWIQPIDKFNQLDSYALGYDNNDKNRNHKILRFGLKFEKQRPSWFQVYELNSNSWRVLDVNPDWTTGYHHRCVSLKGNTYLVAFEETRELRVGVFLICFDFTAERFGPHLPLPFHSFHFSRESVTISGVRDEQLALLYNQSSTILEFWITTEIEPHAASWSKFFKVDTTCLIGFPANFFAGSFFIDEDKKVAVVFNRCEPASYIVGEGGYFKAVMNFGDDVKLHRLLFCNELVFSSDYVPSLVQINQRGKRKHTDFF